MLGLAEALARRQGWRTGRGTASSVEGPWPYATVLDAFARPVPAAPGPARRARRHLPHEIERALSGQDVGWSGESAHQRLFVAAAELMRLAAAGHGLLLVVDDLHDADEASLRLLHYLSRCAMTEPVVIVARAPTAPDDRPSEVEESLRRPGRRHRGSSCAPLDAKGVPAACSRTASPTCDEAGRPRSARSAAGCRSRCSSWPAASGAATRRPAVPSRCRRCGPFQRLALLGGAFTTDELLALAARRRGRRLRHAGGGAGGSRASRPRPATGSATRWCASGWSRRAARTAGRRCAATSPSGWPRSAHRRRGSRTCSSPPACTRGRCRTSLRAVETAGALGRLPGRAHAHRRRPRPRRAGGLPRLLARRGDLLLALGDPDAVAAYLRGGPGDHRHRAPAGPGPAGPRGLASPAIWTPPPRRSPASSREGDAADGPILLAQGHLAYFTGDVDAAWEIANEAARCCLSPDDPWQFVDLVTLQGLVAHQRGEWFERFRHGAAPHAGQATAWRPRSSTRTCASPSTCSTVRSRTTRSSSRPRTCCRRPTHAGALRGVAFARADRRGRPAHGRPRAGGARAAEAVELHRDVDATAGEAHCLQRLAEVRLAQGDRGGRRLLQRALPLARWSVSRTT